jgi:hypothetical protein
MRIDGWLENKMVWLRRTGAYPGCQRIPRWHRGIHEGRWPPRRNFFSLFMVSEISSASALRCFAGQQRQSRGSP